MDLLGFPNFASEQGSSQTSNGNHPLIMGKNLSQEIEARGSGVLSCRLKLDNYFLHSAPEVTPLFFAVYHDREQDVARLLELGASVDEVSSSMGTALHAAACHAHRKGYSILKTLLEKKPDVNAKNGDELTPLHHAVRNIRNLGDNWELVEDLLKAGADPEAITQTGARPIDHLRTYANGFGSWVSGEWIPTYQQLVQKYASAHQGIQRKPEEIQNELRLLMERVLSYSHELSTPMNLPELGSVRDKDEFYYLHDLGVDRIRARRNAAEQLNAALTRIKAIVDKQDPNQPIAVTLPRYKAQSLQQWAAARGPEITALFNQILK